MKTKQMIFPYKLIDLTHTLDSNIPTWNNQCGFNQEIILDYDDLDGEYKFRVMKMQMDAGIGTHMDVPSHCVSGGKYIHEFNVNDLCMPCVVIDVSNKMHERYTVTINDIEAFETVHGQINPKTCVMIKTGWETFWSVPEKYHNHHIFPSVSPEAANLLLMRDIQALGIDTLSADRPEEGFKVHQLLLSNGKILIENVANLNSMPSSGGYVLALPIKVKDATETPIRLVGLI